MMVKGMLDPKTGDVARFAAEGNLPGLMRALRARDPQVSEAATDALAGMGTAATGPLLAALGEKDEHVRLGIIGVLAKLHDPSAVPALTGMLADPGSEVRWQATIALGEIGDTTAVVPLAVALFDADKYVRYGAAAALKKLGWEPGGDGEKAAYCAAMQEWEAVKTLGAPAVVPLDNLLCDHDPAIRLRAVRALGDLGEQGILEASRPVLKALGDADRDVRWEAVLASQRCGVPLLQLPRALSARPKSRKNSWIAGFMNFMLPGLGYGYLGKWWGIMIFQIDITVTVWLFKFEGESNTYLILFPIYLILALHAWYLADRMPEEPP